MKRARHLPGLVRWTSFCVCLSLLLSSAVVIPFSSSTASNRGFLPQGQNPSSNGRERRVAARPPQPGPPLGNLPNLDQMRSETDNARRLGPRPIVMPPAIPSLGRKPTGPPRHRVQARLNSNDLILLARTSLDTTVGASKNARLTSNRRLDSMLTARMNRRDPNASISDSESTLFNPTPPPTDPASIPMAWIDPGNRTGTGGEDLLSNNVNWNLPLVSLPGRGMDLNLSLSYNSLIWTRAGGYVEFTPGQDSISPGFRLSLPEVEGPYWNDQANAYFYLFITPSGGKVELRNTDGSVYESKDSSHLELRDYGTSLVARSMEGMQISFTSRNGIWRPTQIKDRNGNYISISYATFGGGFASYDNISTITDTLGRVISFGYDTWGNMTSIGQSWSGETHAWATFGWGMSCIGWDETFCGSVLTQVGLPDGSRYNFDYTNGAYGQVTTIHYYGADSPPPNTTHQRRYTTYVYANSGTDCPRVSERHDWAENWNGINGVPGEVITTYAHEIDGACTMTAPYGTLYKERYGLGEWADNRHRILGQERSFQSVHQTEVDNGSLHTGHLSWLSNESARD